MQKGFVLIELVIIVAIIGILAAIAVPNFIKFQARSKQSEEAFVSGSIAIGDWPQLRASDARLYLRGGIVHAVYSDPDGNGNYAQGTWRIEQDTLCTTLQMAPAGGCASIYRLPDGSYESWLEGKRVYAFRLKPPPAASAQKPSG